MRQLLPLSGTASNVNQISSTSGHIYNRSMGGGGSIKTTHKTQFRVAGRAIEFPHAIHIADGDSVALVGWERGGVFVPIMLRNEATGVVTSEQSSWFWTILWALLAFGAFLIFWAFSLPFLLFAGVAFLLAQKGRKILTEGRTMLDAIPVKKAG